MTNFKIKMQLNKILTFIQGERGFTHFSECFFTYIIKSTTLQRLVMLFCKRF